MTQQTTQLDNRHIFIVGNSRSGTTMMGRIFNKSPSIHTFEELHYFDELNSLSESRANTESGNLSLVSQLIRSERVGYHKIRETKNFELEARKFIEEHAAHKQNSDLLYSQFLLDETKKNGAVIPCEQTPRYLYHVEKIRTLFPEARILVMVRDPRDVASSQKYRWRVQGKANRATLRSSLQSWSNYHPWITAKTWRSSINELDRLDLRDDIKVLRYEDFVEDPSEQLNDICDFVGIEYASNMLEIGSTISSFEKDGDPAMGIDSNRSGNWKTKGLSNSEISIVESVCNREMRMHGYEPVNLSVPTIYRLLTLLKLPAKLVFIIVFNFGRFKSGFKPLLLRLIG